MNVKNIKVNQIKVLENIRTRIDKKDLASLMESIKQHGLLHPIGVWKENKNYILAWGSRRLESYKKLDYSEIAAAILPNKLTEKEFIVLNTTENLHRLNISPLELGKNCRRLQDMGFSAREVAARLSFPISKINTCIRLYQNVPEGFESVIGYREGGKAKAGELGASIADRILRLRVPKSDIGKILTLAKEKDLTVEDITLIDVFLRSGATIKEALSRLTQYAHKNLKVPVNKKELEKNRREFLSVCSRHC